MTDELDLLQARLDALKAAQRARSGELPMYEHGEPVKADFTPRYRITDKGKAMLRCAPAPIYDDAPGADDSFGWDANGSFVEGAR
jgi:hypothetical protein